MRKWLARLGFSCLILAAVLAWEGYQTQIGRRGAAPRWRVGACYAGAVVLFGAGMWGVRERHRLIEERDGSSEPRD
jgi:hypothetical protein